MSYVPLIYLDLSIDGKPPQRVAFEEMGPDFVKMRLSNLKRELKNKSPTCPRVVKFSYSSTHVKAYISYEGCGGGRVAGVICVIFTHMRFFNRPGFVVLNQEKNDKPLLDILYATRPKHIEIKGWGHDHYYERPWRGPWTRFCKGKKDNTAKGSESLSPSKTIQIDKGNNDNTAKGSNSGYELYPSKAIQTDKGIKRVASSLESPCPEDNVMESEEGKITDKRAVSSSGAGKKIRKKSKLVL